MAVPKYFPNELVPRGCIRNIPITMRSVAGTTGTSGTILFNPSIEVITVIAGVITPSANKVAAPKAATT